MKSKCNRLLSKGVKDFFPNTCEPFKIEAKSAIILKQLNQDKSGSENIFKSNPTPFPLKFPSHSLDQAPHWGCGASSSGVGYAEPRRQFQEGLFTVMLTRTLMLGSLAVSVEK